MLSGCRGAAAVSRAKKRLLPHIPCPFHEALHPIHDRVSCPPKQQLHTLDRVGTTLVEIGRGSSLSRGLLRGSTEAPPRLCKAVF
eukprot:4149718-Prymnesium_polylepis.2